MAQAEGSGSAAGDPAAQPAPEEVRRAVALPSVSGEPGEALTPTTSEPAAPTAAASSAGDGAARTRSDAAASGADAPGDATRASAEGDGRSPEDAGVAAAGAAASGNGNGDGSGAGEGGGDAGRPKKPFLAAAAIAGAVLVAVPLLVLGTVGGDDDTSEKETVANADTLLSERDDEAPAADYLPAESQSPTPSRTPEKSPRSTPSPSRTPTSEPPATSAPPATQKPASNPPAQKPARKAPAKTPAFVKNSLISADTGKCMTVGKVTDGAPVHVWDCDSNREQQWVFQQNGTVKIGDLCLDIGAASTATEAKVQIAYCNGNVAQQFRLNDKGEMVAVISNYCLDVWQGRSNGTKLTTWHCNSQPNQRWKHV